MELLERGKGRHYGLLQGFERSETPLGALQRGTHAIELLLHDPLLQAQHLQALVRASLPVLQHQGSLAARWSRYAEWVVARGIGYPVLVRPSYVLGGRAMEIVYGEEELRRAIYALVDQEQLVVEASGAIAVAPLLDEMHDLKGQTVVCVLSGANIDSQLLANILSQNAN